MSSKKPWMRRAAVLVALLATGLTLPTAAEAVVVCRARMSGEGTGTGLFGAGTNLARQNAATDWANKVRARHGAGFANLFRARSVAYDCRANAILQAKCTITAAPCGDVRRATAKRKSSRRARR